VNTPVEQEQYQVRFDWGLSGARAIGADADVVVLVDVLGESVLEESADLAEQLAGVGAAIVAGSLRNRTAIANWSLARQADKGDRFRIAVVAAGETRTDALAGVGIDYCSPEAAAAAASFTGLRNATGHLVAASTSGRAVAAAGRRAAIDNAIDIDASADVRILREFSFDS
jgi:2-phosphosulfolactate phosphatase